MLLDFACGDLTNIYSPQLEKPGTLKEEFSRILDCKTNEFTKYFKSLSE